MEITSYSPGLNYALRDNILFPGTQAQADALERSAELHAEQLLGLAAGDLLNKFTITIAP